MSNLEKEISKIPNLSKEVTQALITRMIEGDEFSRDELIKHNLKRVIPIAHRFLKKTDLLIDELINIGYMGLIKGIDMHKPSMNDNFNQYLDSSITHAFKAYTKDDKKCDSFESISEETISSELSCEDQIILSTKQELIKELLSCLTSDELEILYLIYGINDGKRYTIEAIAKIKMEKAETIKEMEERAIQKIISQEKVLEVKNYLHS